MTRLHRYRIGCLLLAPALWIAATPAARASDHLSTLAAIQHALEEGDSVSVAIDLSQCVPQGNAGPSQTRGGRRIESYRIVPDGTLSFSDSHFTVAGDGQPIVQFMRYQIRPDQTVDFTTTMFNLPGYDLRTAAVAYRCAIGQGTRFRKD
ncbi:VirK family protein [Paracidovorax konjaci]|uniref:VirK protein n=1 Tax=Paracidovorax konjaci TaxID=32040 RepID=A0A1I1RYN1_9BURK|nr:VirK family protein [Paracidovorax konjaci]SFD39426.1 VirK protein [Paracidovorax konjaci]